MRKYELTYLISDNVPESDLNKVTGKINGYVTSLEGKILKEEIWGRRKLAYSIQKQDFATYVTINFELAPEKIVEFERDLRLSSKIIRHLVILKDFGDEELSLTSEEIVDTSAIEEVIGGEKAFEAVEGQTEESRDLLSVREKEETKEEKIEEKTKEEKGAKKAEVKETKEEVKPVKKATKKAVKKEKEETNEADRLSKLDKELDDILGDDEKL